MVSILIVDDDPLICRSLESAVRSSLPDSECHIVFCHSRKEAKSRALDGYDLVFLDIRMPDGNGLDVIPVFSMAGLPPEIVVITGAADLETAKTAITLGAWDYIQKPMNVEEVRLTVQRALQFRRHSRAMKLKRQVLRDGIVGNSIQMEQALELVGKASTSDASVLITGETGTGKELFARAVHSNSARSDKPFVAVDCGAMPEQLMESLFFGYRKGAYTGADHDAEGLLASADGGTLFLDEIGEMSLELQKKFLRILQDRMYRPVGQIEEQASDFRLVAATNRDSGVLVDATRFRQDLLFRINTIQIHLAPLREQVSQIPLLARHYCHDVCQRYNLPVKQMSDEFVASLIKYPWPGNVRELISVVEHSVLKGESAPVLFPNNLPDSVRVSLIASRLHTQSAQRSSGSGTVPSVRLYPSATLNAQRGPSFQPVAGLQPQAYQTAKDSGSSVESGSDYDDCPMGDSWRQNNGDNVFRDSGAEMDAGGTVSEFPTFKQYREAHVDAVEREYMREVLRHTDGDRKAAMRLSGVSRSRFYQLLKKYEGHDEKS